MSLSGDSLQIAAATRSSDGCTVDGCSRVRTNDSVSLSSVTCGCRKLDPMSRRGSLSESLPRQHSSNGKACRTQSSLSRSGERCPAIGKRRTYRWGVWGATFEEESLRVEPGDVRVAFSDGITEARSVEGDEFGEERLLSCVEQNRELTPTDLLSRLLSTVEQFSAGTAQGDGF